MLHGKETYLGNKVNGENNGDTSMISRRIEHYPFLSVSVLITVSMRRFPLHVKPNA